jgi:transcriptional antiterminator NusG
MEWYVVNTFSGYENTVKKNLEERIEKGALHEQFGEILIPSEKVAERRGKGTVQKTNKFFPGYIFIEMELTKASWHLVQTTPKVTGFLGGQNPRKVPMPEMNRVRWARNRSPTNSPWRRRSCPISRITWPAGAGPQRCVRQLHR